VLPRWPIAAALLCACTPKNDNPTPPAASAAASASASAQSSAAPGEAVRGSDEIKPAYPLEVTPHPLAQRFCEALHALPAKRKAECCAVRPGLNVK